MGKFDLLKAKLDFLYLKICSFLYLKLSTYKSKIKILFSNKLTRV